MGNAVVTGGRYNTLLGRFGKEAPAIGFAIVIDDIMEALSRQKSEIPVPSVEKIYYDSSIPGDFEQKLESVQKLRAEGHHIALLNVGEKEL